MQLIPLQATPSQKLSVTLGGQQCDVAVYQKATGVFLDLSVVGVAVVQGVLCHNRSLLVRQAYLGFTGDLSFIDTQGASDPDYTGMGSRYVLAYLTPTDLV